MTIDVVERQWLTADSLRRGQPLHSLAKDIKLAFFDIDGTLLGVDGNYTQTVQRAIAAVRELGVKTAVASGRPKFAAQFIIDELGLSDAGLFYTGALIFDPQADRLIEQTPLADDLTAAIAAMAKEYGLYTELCTLDQYYVERMTELGSEHSKHLRCAPIVSEFSDLIGREPTLKLLIASTDESQRTQLMELQQRFPEVTFAFAKMEARPEWVFASVISSDACKRQAFSQLLDHHQVAAEQVVAFGDAQSDQVFLQLAGLGVAMGNSSDEVKSSATVVTDAVWNDGVATVLNAICDAKSL